MPTSSPLYTSIRNMEANGEMGLLGDHYETDLVGKLREDGYDSRSGSDVPSGDEQDGSEEQPRRRKKYHRHTPHQIQELENFFKDCPHPDEKQRTELSKRLSLENKQVKFWFQNRRTQMKTQLERHENMILRQENDKLRAENVVIKEALSNPICNTCGGPAIPGHVSREEHHLRIENARLKDELSRICALTGKFLGRPLSPSLELAVGRNGRATSVEPFPPMGLDTVDGASSFMAPMPLRDDLFDRTKFVDLALAAMDELFNLVHVDSPLWIKNQDGKEKLNYEEYARMSNPSIGNIRPGFAREATRDSQMVIINSLALVETLMDTNRWAHMFPCLIARAATIDTISNGMNGTRNGTLLLIKAELQVLSPLVPVRPIRFLRFCKQHADGLWAVVDVSIDINQEASNANPFSSCRKLPSGCIVQDMPNGYSKVTWVEHTEYDETYIHELYQPLISSGLGFGAERWLVTLQRQCECLAILISSSIPNDDPTGISLGGRRSMLKLAQRMVDNFCSGVCASSLHKWEKLVVSNVSEDVKVMMRKSMDDPGEPPGIVLSAATSVWVPVSEQRMFEFLRDERLRSDWDILSNGGPMKEMVHIAKGRDRANCVSLLCSNAVSRHESNMLILQETWSDSSGSLIVYAPVDTPSIDLVMRGGDSAYVSLLPSGFSILRDGRSSYFGSNDCDSGRGNRGCLLTVSFQILVNNLPTAKLTVESVETVNNLISCTVKKIKDALRVT